MRIVLGIYSLAGSGGTESYTVTVGDHLQRTGHDVFIFSDEDGRTGDVARSFGLRVLIGTENLPREIDAFLPQDGVAALRMLEARPAVPQIYGWHSEYFDLQLPPQINDVTKLNVVLHADAYRRVRSLAVKTPVLQLAHPIDTMRFRPLSKPAEAPRTVLSLGNYLQGELAEKMRAACAIAGLEFRHLGLHGEGVTDEPELAINDADILVGKGKVALEGMACGRAVYVYDAFGSDGWVTPQTYPELEANCFAGRTSPKVLDKEAIAAELRQYSQQMGADNRALVVERHSAMTHVGKLVEAIEAVVADGPSAATNDHAFELARLARVNWRHEVRAFELGTKMRELSDHHEWTEQELERTRAELESAQEAARSAAAAAEALVGSTRWKTVSRLMRPIDKLRGRV